ncbi:hypothetical protein SAMN02982931_00066 [Bauldia litoralis]|uniref:Uncharacterized protein n=2 Tax=Bauldia litoralis TaxID=665467 RepID=A0A1G6A1W3_9HYPH|nr:hypothetical protein SAMN02982931_00066 [Bauldia litoralis]
MRHPMRTVAIAAAFAVVAGLAAAPSVLAFGGSSNSIGAGRGWVGGTQNPNDFPNCMIWSQRDRAYMWICGKPYPAGYLHR